MRTSLRACGNDRDIDEISDIDSPPGGHFNTSTRRMSLESMSADLNSPLPVVEDSLASDSRNPPADCSTGGTKTSGVGPITIMMPDRLSASASEALKSAVLAWIPTQTSTQTSMLTSTQTSTPIRESTPITTTLCKITPSHCLIDGAANTAIVLRGKRKRYPPKRPKLRSSGSLDTNAATVAKPRVGADGSSAVTTTRPPLKLPLRTTSQPLANITSSHINTPSPHRKWSIDQLTDDWNASSLAVSEAEAARASSTNHVASRIPLLRKHYAKKRKRQHDEEEACYLSSKRPVKTFEMPPPHSQCQPPPSHSQCHLPPPHSQCHLPPQPFPSQPSNDSLPPPPPILSQPQFVYQPRSLQMTNVGLVAISDKYTSPSINETLPALADQTTLSLNVKTKSPIADEISPYLTDEISPHLADQTSPPLADQITPHLADEISPHLADQISPPLADQTSPHFADQTSPPLADQISPHLADQISPSLADQTSFHLADQISPHLADQISPHLADQISPPLADQISPHLADQTSPHFADQTSPPLADEISPHLADQISPPLADQISPHLANQTSFHLADQTSLHLADQILPPLADQTSFHLADEISPHLADQISPYLADQISPPLTDQISPPLADQTSFHLVDQISPHLSDQISPPLADQISPPLADQTSFHLVDQISPHLADQISPHLVYANSKLMTFATSSEMNAFAKSASPLITHPGAIPHSSIVHPGAIPHSSSIVHPGSIPHSSSIVHPGAIPHSSSITNENGLVPVKSETPWRYHRLNTRFSDLLTHPFGASLNPKYELISDAATTVIVSDPSNGHVEKQTSNVNSPVVNPIQKPIPENTRTILETYFFQSRPPIVSPATPSHVVPPVSEISTLTKSCIKVVPAGIENPQANFLSLVTETRPSTPQAVAPPEEVVAAGEFEVAAEEECFTTSPRTSSYGQTDSPLAFVCDPGDLTWGFGAPGSSSASGECGQLADCALDRLAEVETCTQHAVVSSTPSINPELRPPIAVPADYSPMLVCSPAPSPETECAPVYGTVDPAVPNSVFYPVLNSVLNPVTAVSSRFASDTSISTRVISHINIPAASTINKPIVTPIPASTSLVTLSSIPISVPLESHDTFTPLGPTCQIDNLLRAAEIVGESEVFATNETKSNEDDTPINGEFYL